MLRPLRPCVEDILVSVVTRGRETRLIYPFILMYIFFRVLGIVGRYSCLAISLIYVNEVSPEGGTSNE